MRFWSLIKTSVTSMALMMPLGAHAEWWLGGHNGAANAFIDVESIRVVERIGKTKAWVAFVPEALGPKPSTGKDAKGKPSSKSRWVNDTMRMLIYVDCAEWTVNTVQFIVVDKQTRKTLHSSKEGMAEYGYQDIDTSSMNDTFGKIMCADDKHATLRKLSWWPIETDDYIEYSAKYMRTMKWVNRASSLKKQGKDFGEPPAEVVEVIGQMQAAALPDESVEPATPESEPTDL